MTQRIIMLTVLAAAIASTAFMALGARNFDFHAFYCAGEVARQGANPYYTEPLRTCEMYATDDFLRRQMNGATLPAPFPGYVIAGMEPLSRLPFAVASRLWTALLLLAIAGSAILLTRMSGYGITFAAAALCLSFGVASLGFGEFMPLVLFGICAAAYGAEKGLWPLSAVAAAVCLIEPHIGLPVCVSLFVWRKETRLVLACIGVVLVIISFAALGAAANVEYVTRVLPFHALSEIGLNRQFSLSVIVHALGGSNALALRAGFWSYAVMVFAGVLLARRAAAYFRNGAFLVAVPAAAAVIGGSFVHVTQIAVAIPLAMLVIRETPEHRLPTVIALVALAIPWLWIYEPILIALAVIFAFYLAWAGSRWNATIGCTCAAIALALLVGLNAWAGDRTPKIESAQAQSVPIPSQYAEASWARANLGYWSNGSASSWAYRAPTWCGLLVVFFAAYSATKTRVAVPEPA